MRRYKSPRQVQSFLSVYDHVANLFHIPRDNISAIDDHAARAKAFSVWSEIAAAPFAARPVTFNTNLMTPICL